MDRTFYYIGIAFFGMINGLFNQTWLLLLLHKFVQRFLLKLVNK